MMNADDVLGPVANVLLTYCDRQSPDAQAARRVTQPVSPWPKAESPMLAYLLGAANALIETDGIDGALLWLATMRGSKEGWTPSISLPRHTIDPLTRKAQHQSSSLRLPASSA
jgi:hypothetical protein